MLTIIIYSFWYFTSLVKNCSLTYCEPKLIVGNMKREQLPYKTATMSTRVINYDDPRNFKVAKARDSTEADRRRSLPAETIKLEEQAKGWKFISRMARFNFENPSDRQYVGTYLGYMALSSGLHTSASGTSEVMNRVIDIPEVSAYEWNQTETGLYIQGNGVIDTAVKGADELTFRHMEHKDSATRTRQIGRTFGSSAAFLFNFGQPIPGGTPFQSQFVVRERVMDGGYETMKLADKTGFHASTSALGDVDSQQLSWFRRNAPSQAVYSAIDQTQEEMRERS